MGRIVKVLYRLHDRIRYGGPPDEPVPSSQDAIGDVLAAHEEVLDARRLARLRRRLARLNQERERYGGTEGNNDD